MPKKMKFFLILFLILALAFVLMQFKASSTVLVDNISNELIKKSVNIPKNESKKKEVEALQTEPPNTNETQESYIVVCEEFNQEDFQDIFEQEMEQFYSDLEEFEEIIKDANDIDSQLISTLFLDTSEPDQVIKQLLEIVKVQPEHKLANWNILTFCASQLSTDNKNCSEQVINDAIESDSLNAPSWLNVAAIRIEQHDDTQAIQAMKHLISEPNFNEYYGAHIGLIDRVLEREGAMSRRQRNMASIGFAAAASLPSYGSINKFCTDEGKNRGELALLCLSVGERMMNSGQTIITQVVGWHIKKFAYKNLKEVELLKEFEKEHPKYKYHENLHWKKANQLLNYDSELAELWFNNLITYGEIKAYDIVIEEAIRLSEDENYNPCSKDE